MNSESNLLLSFQNTLSSYIVRVFAGENEIVTIS